MFILGYLIWLASQQRSQVKALTEDMIVIQEKKGIVLTGNRILALDANPLYASTFLKIKNPSENENNCRNTCNLSKEQIVTYLALQGCDNHYNQHGGEENLIKKVNLTMEQIVHSTMEGVKKNMEAAFNKDEVLLNQQHKEQEIECFRICLKVRLCESFGLKNLNGYSICILRTNVPRRYTTVEWSSEYDLNCHIGDKHKFSQSFKSPLDKLLTLENQKSINETMITLEQLSELTQNRNLNRTRRSTTLGAIFGGLVSTLTEGFSLYEIYKLRSHMKQIQQQFDNFRNDVIMFENESVKFHQNILNIYKKLQTKMDEGFSKLDCDI